MPQGKLACFSTGSPGCIFVGRLALCGNDFLATEQDTGISLAVQLLGIRLPMQGTCVQALVREDPTCRGATEPVCHNY